MKKLYSIILNEYDPITTNFLFLNISTKDILISSSKISSSNILKTLQSGQFHNMSQLFIYSRICSTYYSGSLFYSKFKSKQCLLKVSLVSTNFTFWYRYQGQSNPNHCVMLEFICFERRLCSAELYEPGDLGLPKC